jgi:L-threonylcarbamoyladenylate synthase
MYKFNLSEVIKALERGNLIVYPTDTLYALGADIFNKNAIKRIFKVKKRPFHIPLPIAVSSIEDINSIALINDKVRCLADIFLPGPLTLILYKKNNISDILTSGLDKVAVRIPDNDISLKILSEFGPLTVTSANIHGLRTQYYINEIKNELKENVSVYIEYNRLAGKPSTIVDLTGKKPVIVREGIIKKREILECNRI